MTNNYKIYRTKHYALQLTAHLTLTFYICMTQKHTTSTHTFQTSRITNRTGIHLTHPNKISRLQSTTTNTPHTSKHTTWYAYTLPQLLHISALSFFYHTKAMLHTIRHHSVPFVTHMCMKPHTFHLSTCVHTSSTWAHVSTQLTVLDVLMNPTQVVLLLNVWAWHLNIWVGDGSLSTKQGRKGRIQQQWKRNLTYPVVEILALPRLWILDEHNYSKDYYLKFNSVFIRSNLNHQWFQWMNNCLSQFTRTVIRTQKNP